METKGGGGGGWRRVSRSLSSLSPFTHTQNIFPHLVVRVRPQARHLLELCVARAPHVKRDGRRSDGAQGQLEKSAYRAAARGRGTGWREGGGEEDAHSGRNSRGKGERRCGGRSSFALGTPADWPAAPADAPVHRAL